MGASHWALSMRFAATPTAVRTALLAVDGGLANAGAADDLRARAQIALAEACNNIVEHAYKSDVAIADPFIQLDIAGDAGGLQVTLRDRGRPMPDGPLPGRELPPLDPCELTDLPEGGFGWALLRDMARAISMSRRNGHNILRFRLPLSDRPGPFSRIVT